MDYLDQKLENNAALNWKIISKVENKDIKINELRFGKALNYIIACQKYGKGQGDFDEGLFARIKSDNVYWYKKVKDFIILKYGNTELIERQNGKFVDFFIRSHVFNPIACFYSSRLDWWENQDKYTIENGQIEQVVTLKGTIFKDFADTKNLKNELKYSDLIIVNYGILNSLKEEVMQNLETLGVKGVVKIGQINYTRKKDCEWIVKEFILGTYENFPDEFFYKGEEFSYQSEMRIAICSDKNLYNKGPCFWNNEFHFPVLTARDKLIIVKSNKFSDAFDFNDCIIDENDLTIKFSIYVKTKQNNIVPKLSK